MQDGPRSIYEAVRSLERQLNLLADENKELLAQLESRDQRIKELEARIELYRLDHSVRSGVHSEP